MGKKILKSFNITLIVLLLLCSSAIGFLLYTKKILAVDHINIWILVILLVLDLALFLRWMLKKDSRLVLVLAVLYLLVQSFALYHVVQAVSFFQKLNNNTKTETFTMDVVVLKDSKYEAVKDLEGIPVLAALNQDADNVKQLLADIKSKKSVSLEVTEGDSYPEMYQKLLDQKTDAIIMNSVNASLIETNDPEYRDKVRSIYSFTLSKKTEDAKQTSTASSASEKTKEEKQAAEEALKTGAFQIYVSGIDTYGPISSVSRSDVNIVLSVNTKTGKILQTTIPRDAYVRIADGGHNEFDKLTHAGVYGVDASRHTLENLYQLPIQYYVRVNFTSFMKLINLVGGVTVENKQSFKAGGFNFPKGNITLNAEQALVFVRERHNLSSGDYDRGKNQERVIEALIKKLTSADALLNISNIMSTMSDSIQTNMSIEEVMTLVNGMASGGNGFQVESQAVDGKGKMGLPSYAMPGWKLYMMEINQDSLAAATEKMKAVLEGR